MIQKIFRNIALTLAAVSFLAAPLFPATVVAQNATDVCGGVALTGGSCSGSTSGPSVDSTIKLVVNILSTLVGVVSVIMVIIGGLKYITSSGDSNNISSAKNTILYAVIGLIIVALAQVMVRFVLNKVDPSTTTTPAATAPAASTPPTPAP